MSTAVRDNPDFNEKRVEDALMKARGDIFVTSQLLAMTTIGLDRMMRKSSKLMAIMSAIKQAEETEEYDKLTQAQFEQDIARRLTLYRSDALDSMHELATMPVSDDNPLQNQVKLAAASKLAGEVGQTSSAGNDDFLRQLNQEYHDKAPRIKSIRKVETIVELSDEREIPSS